MRKLAIAIGVLLPLLTIAICVAMYWLYPPEWVRTLMNMSLTSLWVIVIAAVLFRGSTKSGEWT